MNREREMLKRALNALTKELMAGPLIQECLDSIDEIQKYLDEPEHPCVALADYVELQRKLALLIVDYKELEQTFNYATGTQWIRNPVPKEESNG
jgi:hypothetical protein